MKSCLSLLGLAGCALAAPAEDLVDRVPDFEKAAFAVYSGYLAVPGPVAGYDELRIHYQFHAAQKNAAKAPVVTWHQGGPGGSSMYGQYAEMGFFQESSAGASVNPYAWNRIANMLYLESPAGSGDDAGYSECHKGGAPVGCSWDDVSQAEAYSATLQAFFKKFPELKNNDLYLTGESYAGQYLPNAAARIVEHDAEKLPNFKGIAVGNGCWGGDAHSVNCNGPNEQKNDLELFWGKGLVSKKAYDAVEKACGWAADASGCEAAYDHAWYTEHDLVVVNKGKRGKDRGSASASPVDGGQFEEELKEKAKRIKKLEKKQHIMEEDYKALEENTEKLLERLKSELKVAQDEAADWKAKAQDGDAWFRKGDTSDFDSESDDLPDLSFADGVKKTSLLKFEDWKVLTQQLEDWKVLTCSA